MEILILGILLWVYTHWTKRLMPKVRARMDARFGAGPARGIIAAAILLSVVMMVVGYRGAGSVAVYTPFKGAGHANNLLMIAAVILMGVGYSKGRMQTWLRHPMLSGVCVWAVAHLLVNGDLASLVLFGGIGLWALISTVLINRAEGAWERPVAGSLAGDLRLIVISAVVFTVIVGIHIWLGYNPFAGNYA